jgi:hypothetical protein
VVEYNCLTTVDSITCKDYLPGFFQNPTVIACQRRQHLHLYPHCWVLAFTNSNARMTCHFEMAKGFALFMPSSCQKTVVASTKAA